jgi:hypothetical protein
MKRLAIAACLLMMAGSPAVAGNPPTSRRAWELGLFTWIKRTPAEREAFPNMHPQVVASARLEQALGAVRVLQGSREEPLFIQVEAAGLAKAMAEAFSLAGPGEDLELVSTLKRDPGLLASALTVTARAFLLDGQLNLIVHDARLDGVYSYTLDHRMPEFEIGSRRKASAIVLKAAGADLRRADWVILPLATETPVSSPMPSTQPQSATKPNLEERLRTLKGLWDKNLITEEDYNRRKLEILREI